MNVALLAVVLLIQVQDAKRVVIVSVDGFRPEFYLADGWEMPALRAWMKAGAHAKGAEAVFPSATYPGHASILTGVRPARHGILSNARLRDTNWHWEAKEIKARTLWQAARDKGLKTAVMFWPSSVGADVDWLVAERLPSTPQEKHADLLLRHSTKGLLPELALALGMPKREELEDRGAIDRFIVDALCYVLKKHKPSLAFAHIGQTDHAQHQGGSASDEARVAVRRTDENLARLRAALEAAKLADETLVIVTGDHGFDDAREMIQPNVLLAQAGLLSADDWQACVMPSGGGAMVHAKDESSAKRAREVLEKGAIADGRRLYTMLDPKEAVAFGYAASDLLLEAEPGLCFGGGFEGAVAGHAAPVKGVHGYRPTREKMRTGFIALGAGVRPGACVDLVRLIDIAPTVAHVLGLEMKDVEGRVLKELIR